MVNYYIHTYLVFDKDVTKLNFNNLFLFFILRTFLHIIYLFIV